ncbi:MAG: hypothetical protein IKD74_04930 [Clostridia bacterium]|nr:hypothetical protein [Clostridia bacterium]
MHFFTIQEFKNKYNQDVALWQIEMACEMIYNQVGLKYRDPSWTEDTCPTPIKNASMEQLRFILEYDIPVLDNRGTIKAGAMESNLISDISTLALRILGNNGYLYRGNPVNYNMGLNIPFGE